jgi:hypothetical protein
VFHLGFDAAKFPSEKLLGAVDFLQASKNEKPIISTGWLWFFACLIKEGQGKESRGSLRGLRAGPASFPGLFLPIIPQEFASSASQQDHLQRKPLRRRKFPITP